MISDSNAYSKEVELSNERQGFMTKVYGWMAVALLITGIVAMFAASSPALIGFVTSSSLVFYGLIVVELLVVGYLVSRVENMSAQVATLTFVGYAALNGITLSLIFLVYTAESLASTFFITAGTFGVTSLYGYLTKSDLSKWGNLLMMGLIGIIIASVVNFFFQNEMLYWITTYAGVLIFVGLTAYDTQKIKESYVTGTAGSEETEKTAIMGALSLYLDFINLFLLLLRLFGDRD